MKIAEIRLGFVGFGHMAQVICKAVEKAKLIPRSQIVFIRRDTAKMRQNEQEFGITSTTIPRLVEESDILLLGVRPNQAETALKELAKHNLEGKILISVLAGVKLSFYQKILGSRVPLLRVMPNTASEVGEGMSVFTYGPDVSTEWRSLSHLLFSCMGEVIEVDESLTDISCGIAGSGPGFVFRLIEAMARAGEKNGLSRPKALKMAAQAFLGAGRLIVKGADPQKLIQQIAVPNGTTEAGFKVMDQTQIESHFQEVIEACAYRSKQLAEEFK